MLYGELQGEDSFSNCTATETKIVPDDTCEEKEQHPTKMRLRVFKENQKAKNEVQR